MNNKINLIIATVVLAFIGMACSFSTANISSFNFGKNDSANPPVTTFDISDKIYAVAVVSNTSSKHKMRFKVTFENVQGKNKGEEMASKDIDFENARPVFLFFNAPAAGEYRVDATLLGEDGKELDKKSGTIKVTGETKPNVTEKPADSDDSEDKDDK